jgi:hypothetical protein
MKHQGMQWGGAGRRWKQVNLGRGGVRVWAKGVDRLQFFFNERRVKFFPRVVWARVRVCPPKSFSYRLPVWIYNIYQPIVC